MSHKVGVVVILFLLLVLSLLLISTNPNLQSEDKKMMYSSSKLPIYPIQSEVLLLQNQSSEYNSVIYKDMR